MEHWWEELRQTGDVKRPSEADLSHLLDEYDTMELGTRSSYQRFQYLSLSATIPVGSDIVSKFDLKHGDEVVLFETEREGEYRLIFPTEGVEPRRHLPGVLPTGDGQTITAPRNWRDGQNLYPGDNVAYLIRSDGVLEIIPPTKEAIGDLTIGEVLRNGGLQTLQQNNTLNLPKDWREEHDIQSEGRVAYVTNEDGRLQILLPGQ